MNFRILLAGLIVTLLIVVIATTTIANGGVSAQDLKVNTIILEDAEPGKSTVGFVSLDNTGRGRSDLSIRITVPDLGIIATAGPFDLSAGETGSRKLLIYIPEGAEKGEYWARIVVSNDDIKRVKHRPFVVA